MTGFTIIVMVLGLIISLSLLFGSIAVIDGIINKLPSKVKMGSVLLTVAVVLLTIGGIKGVKKVYQQRKYQIWLQWYQNDLAYKEYCLKKTMCAGHEGMDSKCCPQKDSLSQKKCDPATCEHHK